MARNSTNSEVCATNSLLLHIRSELTCEKKVSLAYKSDKKTFHIGYIAKQAALVSYRLSFT
jgi:hypothetical protein